MDHGHYLILPNLSYLINAKDHETSAHVYQKNTLSYKLHANLPCLASNITPSTNLTSKCSKYRLKDLGVLARVLNTPQRRKIRR